MLLGCLKKYRYPVTSTRERGCRVRIPSRRDASNKKRMAQLDEHFAVLRVIQARVRRRYAEVTIEVIERVDSTRRFLRSENGLAGNRLIELMKKARELWRRGGGR